MNEREIRQFCNFQMDVYAYAADFFSNHKIRFFGYSRTYENKKCFWLSTHPEVYEYLLKHRLPLNAPAPSGHVQPFFYHYMAPSTEYFEMTQDIIVNFRLYHPLDLVFQRDGYYELFCLAVDHQDQDILSYYFNNISHFKKFCLNFTKEASRVIETAKESSILLPDEMFGPVSSLISPHNLEKTIPLTMSNFIDAIMSTQTRDLPLFKKSKQYLLDCGNTEIHLTKRELQCLLCLLKGKTAQESADELFIDRRTVETYIDRLRQRTLTDSKLMLTTHVYRLLLESVDIMGY